MKTGLQCSHIPAWVTLVECARLRIQGVVNFRSQQLRICVINVLVEEGHWWLTPVIFLCVAVQGTNQVSVCCSLGEWDLESLNLDNDLLTAWTILFCVKEIIPPGKWASYSKALSPMKGWDIWSLLCKPVEPGFGVTSKQKTAHESELWPWRATPLKSYQVRSCQEKTLAMWQSLH